MGTGGVPGLPTERTTVVSVVLPSLYPPSRSPVFVLRRLEGPSPGSLFWVCHQGESQ